MTNEPKGEEHLFNTNVIERAEQLGFKRDMTLDHTANYQLALEYIDSYYRYGAADKEDII